MVLSIGQFIHRKGFDVLLKAAENLDKSIGIYIIGGSPDDSYIQMAKNAGEERIHFLDYMDKLALEDYFRAADIFVLPTREDVWGLVVNEAMAHAIPVVTTDKCVAVLELVGEKAGRIAVSGDCLDLKKKINERLYDRIENIQDGIVAQQIIKSYTFEEMAEVHLRILRSQL